MVSRFVNPLKNKSFFLFGARGSGKTTWLKTRYPEDQVLWIDLLDLRLQDELMLDLTRFESWISDPKQQGKTVVVDEIQKFPRLLDTVHQHITKNKRQFILTGSSARRLKQAGTNLLAGRAAVYSLFPFSALELGSAFQLQQALETGLLPEVYLSETVLERTEFLVAYSRTYLEKEIQQEQWVRKIEPFRKFLAIAAQMNGKIINRAKIAKEVGVDDMTVASYYEILEDTLLGVTLPAYHTSIRKAQRLSPKFYFIDPGVVRALGRTLTVPLLPQTSAYGEAFEHWFFLELYKNAEYLRLDWKFHYIRTKDDLEIDFVIERPGKPLLLIELKSKNRISEADIKSLQTLGYDLDPSAERVLVSQDPTPREFATHSKGTVQALFWKDALDGWFRYE